MIEQKKAIRKTLRQKRKALSADERKQMELQLKRHLQPFVKRGRKIAAYLACGSEADLLPWIRYAQKRGCRVFVPFIDKKCKRLWFTEYHHRRNTLHSRPYFGIPQYEGKKYRAEQLQVILLPLLGIDQQGIRMGQGGGFYDASLQYCVHRADRPKLIGVGFACQMVEVLPRDPWDIPLDAFVSEEEMVCFK